MALLADELRRMYMSRLQTLEGLVDGLHGRLEPSRAGLRAALGLVREYPGAARTALDVQWDLDPAGRTEAVRMYLTHLSDVANLVETWFAKGGDIGAPKSLARAVDREFEALRSRRRAVLAIGPPSNFETYIPDLYDSLFRNLSSRSSLPPRADFPTFAMIQVPRLEGGQALWRPLVIGHEVAHLALGDRPNVVSRVDLSGALASERAQKLSVPGQYQALFDPVPTVLLNAIAGRWLEELLCDAYAVRRFGPAAAAAMGTFLEAVGGFERFGEHPPGWTRMQLMLRWLGPVRSPSLRGLLEPWEQRLKEGQPTLPPWAMFLGRTMEQHSDEIMAALQRWPARYDVDRRAAGVVWSARRLGVGVPSDVIRRPGGRVEPLLDADVLNGAWVAWSSGTPFPVERLTTKALESIEFSRLLRAADQAVQDDEDELDPLSLEENTANHGYGGVMPAAEVRHRFAEGAAGQIVVSPEPQRLSGSAMDVRLGNRFIVFEPSGTASFDPIKADTDPRVLQGAVEKDWGEEFVLHPGELVLAAVLEYISLPGDVACLVVTRSSYGRLGLVTATAVLVHPYFQGCLTLELVNLGRVPLVLSPGERVGQLVFLRVHEPVPPPSGREKYRCPTGPEFSKVREDRDAKLLAWVRSRTRDGSPADAPAGARG